MNLDQRALAPTLRRDNLSSGHVVPHEQRRSIIRGTLGEGEASVSLVRVLGDLLIQPTFLSAIPRCLVDSFRGFEKALELELVRQRQPAWGFEPAQEIEVVLFVVSQWRFPPPLPIPDRGFDRERLRRPFPPPLLLLLQSSVCDRSRCSEALRQLEEKAKFKYSDNMRPGRSLFSAELLNNGQKCFDSGDYNMAKAKGQKTAPRVTPRRSLEPHGTDHPHSGVLAAT
ncbi:hypothetical protein MRX96_054952 [Rhipicephalus microplus]